MVWAKALARSAARTPQRRRNGAPRGATHLDERCVQLRTRRAFRCAVPLFMSEEGLFQSSGAIAPRERGHRFQSR